MQKQSAAHNVQGLARSIINPIFKIILISPILPGKSEAWRRFIQEMQVSQRAVYEASRHRLGITAEWAWIVETLRGDVAVIIIESEQPGPTLTRIATSDDPFDRWFREQLLVLQGVDLTRAHANSDLDLVFEWYRL